MSREVMQMALDALVTLYMDADSVMAFDWPKCRDAMHALRDELAKPEPDPVGYFVESAGTQWAKHGFDQVADMHANDEDVTPLYRKVDA